MAEKESRKAKRYDIEAAAEITAPGGVLQSLTKNLSETGVCLTTKRMLEEGQKFQISLFLIVDGIEDISSPSIDLTAEVIWSAPSSEDEFLAGCQFVDVSGSQLEVLRSFLRQLEE
jgi:hypothetical protein